MEHVRQFHWKYVVSRKSEPISSPGPWAGLPGALASTVGDDHGLLVECGGNPLKDMRDNVQGWTHQISDLYSIAERHLT